MFVAFARRSVRLLPQVRLIRSQPTAVGPIPPLRGNRRRAEPEDDEQIIVGETMEVKFEKYPKLKKENLLENPSVMTLVKQHRVEIDENAEPKVGYTDDELQLFDSIAEIKIDDALLNYKDGSFDSEFLDSVGPGLTPTYNIAAVADKHEVVKQLVALNVSLHKWDKSPEILKKMLALNWHKDCKPKIEFLVQKCGLEPAGLGKMLSRNPLLLTQEMQHREARYDYIRDKKEGLGLKKREADRVLSKEAFWLSTPIEAIENRINFFQNQFGFDAEHFKRLVVSRPSIIMVQLRNLVLKKFSMIEEMGFDQAEIRRAVMNAPKILTLSRLALVERFQVLHLDIGYDHTLVASHSAALYCRATRMKERHAFLVHLGRAQYDNHLPGYISPERLTRGNDEQFVEKVAMSTKEEFEKFIKKT